MPKIESMGCTPESFDERWRDFELLQLYDRLSLYFCMREGEEADIQGYGLEPVGPWRVRISPYPFVESPARFSLLRRVLPRSGTADVLAMLPDQVAITFEDSPRHDEGV